MRFAHRSMDPRAKLAFATAVAVVAIAIPRLDSLVVLAGIVTATVATGRDLTLRDWLGSLAPFKVLVPIIFLLNSFFYGGGRVLIAFPGIPLSVTADGLLVSAVIVARLLVVASIASWFAMTTDPEEFEVAITRLGAPWSFAFLLSLTLRLVPEMRLRYQEIDEAQRARGLEISGNPLKRARDRIPMLVPFLAAVIHYGYDLSEALEARDYGVVRERTSVVSLAHGRVDYLFYGFSVALLAGFGAVFLR